MPASSCICALRRWCSSLMLLLLILSLAPPPPAAALLLLAGSTTMDPHPPAAPPREFIFERPRSPLLPGAEPSMAFIQRRDPGNPGPSSVLPLQFECFELYYVPSRGVKSYPEGRCMDGSKRNAIGAGVITLTDLLFPPPARLRWFGDLPIQTPRRENRVLPQHRRTF